MSHIVKATELKLFAKFHDDWSKQFVSNATSPNYANYEMTHALTRLRIPSPQVFSVNGSITCNQAALLTSFWRHRFNMTKFFPNLVNSSSLFVMVNYACGFNQAEMGKYFKWIIRTIIPWSPNMVTVRVCSKLKTSWKSVVFTNKVAKNSRYFVGVLYKTIIPLALVGYAMIIANSYPPRTRGIIVKYTNILYNYNILYTNQGVASEEMCVSRGLMVSRLPTLHQL